MLYREFNIIPEDYPESLYRRSFASALCLTIIKNPTWEPNHYVCTFCNQSRKQTYISRDALWYANHGKHDYSFCQACYEELKSSREGFFLSTWVLGGLGLPT